MNAYLEEKVKPLRRAIILGFLESSQDFISNADILTTVINGSADGVRVYYSDVVEELRWLEAKGYVRISGDSTVVAEATPAGLRIARRQNADPGISRDVFGA